MISQNRLKFFASLKNKKFREEYGMFLAEGEKIVSDILACSECLFKAETLIAAPEFLENIDARELAQNTEVIEVSMKELMRISSFTTPNKAILVCRKPQYQPEYEAIAAGLSVFLDEVRDPGNLGTIIRTADWFGINDIFCTPGSVEVYNPKVIQSSMGSVCRVRVHYRKIDEVYAGLRKTKDFKIYATVLDGRNIYIEDLSNNALLILGNESRGISGEILEYAGNRLTIPSPDAGERKSDSLNIASAAAIAFSEFRRRNYSK